MLPGSMRSATLGASVGFTTVTTRALVRAAFTASASSERRWMRGTMPTASSTASTSRARRPRRSARPRGRGDGGVVSVI